MISTTMISTMIPLSNRADRYDATLEPKSQNERNDLKKRWVRALPPNHESAQPGPNRTNTNPATSRIVGSPGAKRLNSERGIRPQKNSHPRPHMEPTNAQHRVPERSKRVRKQYQKLFRTPKPKSRGTGPWGTNCGPWASGAK